MRSLGQVLRGIISFRHHYIMRIRFEDSPEEEICSNLILKRVSDETELIAGTYSVSLQKKILDMNTGKCDTFILKENNMHNNIGILSVMYKGGDELEYKIRDIEAFIYNVKIAESFRGKGFAGIMIRMLGAQLRKRDIRESYLAVSTDNYSAIKAYSKIGFETIAERRFIRTLKRNFPYYYL